jgi:hypothetical protein
MACAYNVKQNQQQIEGELLLVFLISLVQLLYNLGLVPGTTIWSAMRRNINFALQTFQSERRYYIHLPVRC